MNAKYSIRRQAERIENERKWWRELRELADSDDPAQFWLHYARYLESQGSLSGHRQLLRDMAIASSAKGK